MIRYGITAWAGQALINLKFRCNPNDAQHLQDRFDLHTVDQSAMEGQYRIKGIIPYHMVPEFIDMMKASIIQAQISKLKQDLDNMHQPKAFNITSISPLDPTCNDDLPF